MSILHEIVDEKVRELHILLPRANALKEAALARKERRDFYAALNESRGIALIAEVKKASPSAGVIQPNFDPVRIAREYEAAGAAAISVLTESKFFQGRIEYLQQIRDAVKLPLLRKDFLLHEVQLYEAVASGADAVLLIVSMLQGDRLVTFLKLAAELNIAALVEVHDEAELIRALEAGAEIIGINNRDIKTFSVDLATTERLVQKIGVPKSTATEDKAWPFTRPIIVAESGINTRADVERVAKAGVNAILVGESLMRSGDIAAKVKELLG